MTYLGALQPPTPQTPGGGDAYTWGLGECTYSSAHSGEGHHRCGDGGNDGVSEGSWCTAQVTLRVCQYM